LPVDPAPGTLFIAHKIGEREAQMSKIKFTVKLESADGGGLFFTLPRKESESFGVRGRVPVVGTLNGHAFRSSIFPIGDGTHYMAVNKSLRESAGVGAGDRVQVVMEVDRAPRTVTLPPDFDKALAKSGTARTRFDKLSYTHQKEIVRSLEEAKRAETRAR
jgi:hypothetical protein